MRTHINCTNWAVGIFLAIAMVAMFAHPCIAQVTVSKNAASAVELPIKASDQSADTLIVFFRPRRFTGSALAPSVYVDGQQVARLDNGRYFSFRVPSGKHSISSSMKESPLDLDLKSGQAVYLEMVILVGTWRGGGRYIPAPTEDALPEIKKLKPLDANRVIEKRVGFDIQLLQPTDAHNTLASVQSSSGSAERASPMSVEGARTATDVGAQATLEISSVPLAAEIELDGSFSGNTPSSIGVAAGEHTIRISKPGFKVWERKIKTSTGDVKVVAEMEPETAAK